MHLQKINFVIFGAPGTGKGTHGKRIAEEYDIAHISTGEILRDAQVENDTLKEIMNSGDLVPDTMMIELIGNRILEEDCYKGFILDGFPRTVVQAEALNIMLSDKGMTLNSVLALDAPEKVLLERLTSRIYCSDQESCKAEYSLIDRPPKVECICDNCQKALYHRDDDNKTSVMKRLDVFYNKTAPVLDYYDSNESISLVRVNTNGEKNEVSERISNSLLSEQKDSVPELSFKKESLYLGR